MQDSSQPFFSVSGSAAEVAPLTPPASFGGRFVREGLLGQGGFGQVFLCQDTLLGDRAAVKWLPGLGPEEQARARREATGLRAMRLPGVVGLRDEGAQDGGLWLAMDLVEGSPFPGGTFTRWEGPLGQRCVALLCVLDGLHRRGVVHRDLKPANILVRPDGSPVLLDFGLAWGAGVGRPGVADPAGTPRWMAPEQLRGGALSGRTDVYALGAILYEHLSGRPHRDPRQARAPLRGLAPELEPAQAELIEGMLAEDPADRPSASQALAALGWRSPVPRLPPGQRLGAMDLHPLFCGPDRLLHLAEDATALLLQRSGGERALVEQELDLWLRQGITTLAPDGRLKVSREGLRARGLPQPWPQAAEQVQAQVETLEARGQVEEALTLCELALREEPARPLQEALVRLALSTMRASTLEQALYALGRCEPVSTELEGLLRAGLRAVRGDGENALSALDALPPLSEPRLEVWRHALRVHAALRCESGTVERVLQALEAARASTPGLGPSLDGWWGMLRYRQERYEQAAALHQRAAEGKSAASGRLSSLLSAASAWLECGRLEQASALAQQAQDEASRSRHSLYELRAQWLSRALAWRLGQHLPPDLELLGAAEALGALLGQVALQEAAFAWRAGDLPLALNLAEEAERALTRDRQPGALLARALRLHLRPDPAEARALAQEALRCPVAGFALQALGFALYQSPDPSDLALLEQMVARQVHPALRQELLSAEEALRLAAGSPPTHQERQDADLPKPDQDRGAQR